MIRFALLSAFCLMNAAALAEDVLGQGEFRYRVVPDWGREALAHVSVKNGHAVALDAQGRLLFLTDDPKNNVVILDANSGALIRHWTARMPGAHGMSLVREGDCEVRKLTLEGEELTVLPWPEKAKLHASAKEFRPSKTIHFPGGDFAVFDGYGKDYIFHYKADGTLLRTWGGDLGAPEDQLKHWGPHGGAFDDRGGTPRIVIAMSDQQEIRRFGVDGRFIDQVPFPGGNPRDIVLFGDFTIIPHLGDQWPKDRNSPGFISIVDSDWNVVSNIGAPPAVYEKGVLQAMKSDGRTFIHPHGVAVDANGNLYVAQFASAAAPLLKLERIK